MDDLLCTVINNLVKLKDDLVCTLIECLNDSIVCVSAAVGAIGMLVLQQLLCNRNNRVTDSCNIRDCCVTDYTVSSTEITPIQPLPNNRKSKAIRWSKRENSSFNNSSPTKDKSTDASMPLSEATSIDDQVLKKPGSYEKSSLIQTDSHTDSLTPSIYREFEPYLTKHEMLISKPTSMYTEIRTSCCTICCEDEQQQNNIICCTRDSCK